MTSPSLPLTLWAVSNPADPHETSPAHFVATSEEAARVAYLVAYWGGEKSGREITSNYPGDWREDLLAAEVDLAELAERHDLSLDCRTALDDVAAALDRLALTLDA